MSFVYKLSTYVGLYKLVPIRITHHPFFKHKINRRGFFFNPLFLLGCRRNRLVFSFLGLFSYFLKIKSFFSYTPKKSFIIVSNNELNYFISKSIFVPSEASCIFAPRLGFLTNTSNFLSSNRISKNQLDYNSFFLLYLGRGGLINVLKESLILNLPVFAVIGSMHLLDDTDYPLFSSQSDMRSVYFYCSFIAFIRKFSF